MTLPCSELSARQVARQPYSPSDSLKYQPLRREVLGLAAHLLFVDDEPSLRQRKDHLTDVVHQGLFANHARG